MLKAKNVAATAVAACVVLACDRSAPTTPLESGALDAEFNSGRRELSLERCAFGQRFTLYSGNDYFPLTVGSRWHLRGTEDGARFDVHITVLDETEVVGGVTARVVEERELEDGELLEVSRNYFAVAGDGTICYFGEAVDIYEDGEVSHEGAWRADDPGNFPGIIMPGKPRPGLEFQMEGAPGIAEDRGTVLGSGRVRTPAGSFTETIRIREVNPLDGDVGFKVYAEDVGIVIDGPLSLVRYSVAGSDDDDGDDDDDDDDNDDDDDDGDVNSDDEADDDDDEDDGR